MNAKSPNDKQSTEGNVAALKEVNARYRRLMNLSGDGIIIVQ
jgi:hypothetical protein